MALRQPATDESALNMTPMIDIVFQLILFFMLNMKFKALDKRHEVEIPQNRGIRADPVWTPPFPSIEATLKRRPAAGGDRTRIEVAGVGFELPAGAVRDDDHELQRRRDSVQSALRERIRSLALETRLPGKIHVPATPGGSVPHGDVLLVLDAFVAAEVTDVAFVGAPPARPRR